MVRELVETAVRAARRGARVLRRDFRQGGLEVRAKGHHDFVSSADRESEAEIVAELRRAFPRHHVLAEEGGLRRGGTSDFEWLVDPLDGTSNFLQGLPYFAVSIACRHRGELLAGVVLDPVDDNLFTAGKGEGAWWNGRPMRVSRQAGLAGSFLATGYPFRSPESLDLYLSAFRQVFLEARGIRRCGAAALDLAYTAAGVYDAFFEFRLSPWDIAAGALLVREAGGRVTDLDGGDAIFAGGNLVAGAPAVQRQLLAAVRRHVSEAALDAAEEERNKTTEEVVG